MNSSQAAIRKGSKSFYLAGLILSPDVRAAAFDLYHWCRHCDDAIDESPDPAPALELLRRQTRLAMQDTLSQDDQRTLPAPFLALRRAAKAGAIPEHYPLELLEGMRMDTEGTDYANQTQLNLYAYRVAGTVGLMMSHVLGLASNAALAQACHMGMAMQLTNIVRDVKEDAKRGRVYLPSDLLSRHGLTRYDVLKLNKPQNIHAACLELLRTADRYYASGDQGLPALRWRTAFAIAAARRIYWSIGKLIALRGASALQIRNVVSLPAKLMCVARAFGATAAIGLQQWRRGWQPIELREVYYFESKERL